MFKKLFNWLAKNEFSRMQAEIDKLRKEAETYKHWGYSGQEEQIKKLTEENLLLKKQLQKTFEFSKQISSLKEHSLFLEKLDAQRKHREAGLQHIFLWAVDAKRELEFLTNGKTKEYLKLDMELKNLLKKYKIVGFEDLT